MSTQGHEQEGVSIASNENQQPLQTVPANKEDKIDSGTDNTESTKQGAQDVVENGVGQHSHDDGLGEQQVQQEQHEEQQTYQAKKKKAKKPAKKARKSEDANDSATNAVEHAQNGAGDGKDNEEQPQGQPAPSKRKKKAGKNKSQQDQNGDFQAQEDQQVVNSAGAEAAAEDAKAYAEQDNPVAAEEGPEQSQQPETEKKKKKKSGWKKKKQQNDTMTTVPKNDGETAVREDGGGEADDDIKNDTSRAATIEDPQQEQEVQSTTKTKKKNKSKKAKEGPTNVRALASDSEKILSSDAVLISEPKLDKTDQSTIMPEVERNDDAGSKSIITGSQHVASAPALSAFDLRSLILANGSILWPEQEPNPSTSRLEVILAHRTNGKKSKETGLPAKYYAALMRRTGAETPAELVIKAAPRSSVAEALTVLLDQTGQMVDELLSRK